MSISIADLYGDFAISVARIAGVTAGGVIVTPLLVTITIGVAAEEDPPPPPPVLTTTGVQL
jgi:hypothetical protein